MSQRRPGQPLAARTPARPASRHQAAGRGSKRFERAEDHQQDRAAPGAPSEPAAPRDRVQPQAAAGGSDQEGGAGELEVDQDAEAHDAVRQDAQGRAAPRHAPRQARVEQDRPGQRLHSHEVEPVPGNVGRTAIERGQHASEQHVREDQVLVGLQRDPGARRDHRHHRAVVREEGIEECQREGDQRGRQQDRSRECSPGRVLGH